MAAYIAPPDSLAGFVIRGWKEDWLRSTVGGTSVLAGELSVLHARLTADERPLNAVGCETAY